MQALILKVLTYLFTLPFLAGYRTYIVAAGLLGKAIYDLSVGEYPQAVTDFLGFLAAVGVRAAVATGQVMPKVSVVLVALFLAASGGFAAEPKVYPKSYAEAVKIATEKHQPLVAYTLYFNPPDVTEAVLYLVERPGHSDPAFKPGVWLCIPWTNQMYPLPMDTKEAQKAVDYVNCHEPNPQPVGAVNPNAPYCPYGKCGMYVCPGAACAATGCSCGCQPQAVGGFNVTPIYVGPPGPSFLGPTPSVFPLTPVRGQLQLQRGLLPGNYGGCANGTCSGGR